jgi:lysophospholipase L1-like esterase
MICLRSEVYPNFFQKKIDYSQETAFIGSCFAENIGEKFKRSKLPCIINPFGILYNPQSVNSALLAILENKIYKEGDLDFFNEKWISFAHHGQFSGANKAEVLKNINEQLKAAHVFLQQTNVLLVTFGTAWVYKLKKSNEVVANCHKVPANEFDHFLLTSQEIIDNYVQFLQKIRAFNPNIEVVFTVSPVRHWKDGAVNNQLSKSILFVAVHELVSKFDFVHYFPSYEILMDDLRDYRFYADDLFHPNQLAIDYIWEKFSKTFFNEKTIETTERIEKLQKNLSHRVFYPQTEAYRKFIISNFKLIGNLQVQFPAIDFERELNHFKHEAEKYWPGEF